MEYESHGQLWFGEVIGPGIAVNVNTRVDSILLKIILLQELLTLRQQGSLGPGEEGELVLHHLQKALPILRYRTRDISVLMEEPCKCGRTSMRMKGTWEDR